MDSRAPDAGEIEFSIFGRGYGEAICIHLGDGKWMLVDSCLNPSTGVAASLEYLSSLHVSAESQVGLVIATHWHDDHVQGLGSVVELCASATVVCSSAVCSKEFIVFVLEQENSKGALGSGLDEFRSVLRTCAMTKRSIVWAKANLPLHPRPPGQFPQVIALSPSEDASERTMRALIESTMNARSSLPRRYRAPEDANGASIAAWVHGDDISLLLGADLECSENPETGWGGLLKHAKPWKQASAVKIPHHGSAGAHDDAMWSSLLEPDALAILTPWIRGSKRLPTDADLARLVSFSKNVYITALPSRAAVTLKADKITRRLHAAPITGLRGWGHIRARRRSTESSWRVDLDGDATQVDILA